VEILLQFFGIMIIIIIIIIIVTGHLAVEAAHYNKELK
jgi:hypothetical protein